MLLVAQVKLVSGECRGREEETGVCEELLGLPRRCGGSVARSGCPPASLCAKDKTASFSPGAAAVRDAAL
eukprot:Skav224806  [mRNA]  locus=scaffold764:691351:692403:- [translate_table: standard]